MLNDPFRTSLTRDEIIGYLLGWLEGPVILQDHTDEMRSTDEEECFDSWSYSVYEDREEREAEAFEKRIDCLASGQPEALCNTPVEDFKREDEAFRRLCDKVDDEISKGSTSALRIDQRSSTATDTCYTRMSINAWTEARTDLSPYLSSSHKMKDRPLSESQDEAILACITKLGHTATRLDPRKPGQKGIKHDVRAQLRDKPPFETAKIFDNAWQRLRDAKKIVEAPESPPTTSPQKMP